MAIAHPHGSASLPRTTPATARLLGVLATVALLVVALVLSISVGARPIPFERVWELVLSPDGSEDALIVQDGRIPRTLLGLLVGAALGSAGALMQALTRNPLADPGLLGVNGGASAAIVTAMATLGVTGFYSFVWFGLLGAAIASVVVYALGASGSSGASPVRLALAGTAITATLLAFVEGMTLLKPILFREYRHWEIGSLAGHEAALAGQIAPFVVAGLLLTLALARPLNALALGDEAGRALGANVHRTRAAGALGVVLLCGAATAAIGPVLFLGLGVAHIARALVGPDQRWVLPLAMLLGPVLLLLADVIGRVVERPSEVQVGVVAAFLGAPLFIALVRRRRIAQL